MKKAPTPPRDRRLLAGRSGPLGHSPAERPHRPL